MEQKITNVGEIYEIVSDRAGTIRGKKTHKNLKLPIKDESYAFIYLSQFKTFFQKCIANLLEYLHYNVMMQHVQILFKIRVY